LGTLNELSSLRADPQSSSALMHLEPICALMCAARDDRMTEVVPYLQREIDFQTAQFDDVEQSQAYQGEEVASYLFHAFGTNLQFAPGEFNFVKTRAQHGTKEAFRLRDEHFNVPEPGSS
jgi:hypothetical protein